MNTQIAAARAHPAVIVAMAIAALAVAACAIVAIAYMVGWIPQRASAPASVGASATPAPAHTASGTIDLLPGESLVTSPEPPKSAIPVYNKPPPEALAPVPLSKQAGATPAPPRPEPPAPTAHSLPAPPPPQPQPQPQPVEREPRPVPPTYARAPAPPASLPPLAPPPLQSPREPCVNCGTIASVTADGFGRWEVRVEFDDGARETLAYRRRPPLRTGQRIHLEEGRLVVD